MPDRRRVRILTTRGAYAGGCTAGVRRDAQVGGAAGARGSTSDPYTSFGPPYVDESLTVSTDDGLKLHVEVVDAVDGVDLTPEFLPPVGVPAITLVFVHGLCLDMGTFYLQRKELARLGEWRMVFYDQPGHGRSGRLTQGEYTLDSLGRALRRVVEETSPGDPVVLVGHSMGGMAILALAELHPQLFTEQVAGVVLIAPPAGRLEADRVAGVVPNQAAARDIPWQLTGAYGFRAAPPGPALVSFVEGMSSGTPTDTVARCLRALDTPFRRPPLEALRDVPVLVIVGDKDRITPARAAEIWRQVPDVELVTVPNGGHLVLLEQAEVVNHALLRFLDQRLPGVRHPDQPRPSASVLIRCCAVPAQRPAPGGKMTTTTSDPAAPFRTALAAVGLPGWLRWSVMVSSAGRRLDAIVEPTGAVEFAVPAGATPEEVAAAVRRMLGRLLTAAAHKRDHGARIVARSLLNGEAYPFAGRPYRLAIVDDGPACEVRRLPVGQRTDGTGSIGWVPLLCLRRDRAHASTVIEWYRAQGQEWLDQHIPAMAQRLGIVDGLTWSVRRYRADEGYDGSWGLYRPATHSIDLNWMIFQFPADLLRYVAAHEVAHAALRGAYGHGRQRQLVISRLVPTWRELDGPARSADGLVLWSGEVTRAGHHPAVAPWARRELHGHLLGVRRHG